MGYPSNCSSRFPPSALGQVEEFAAVVGDREDGDQSAFEGDIVAFFYGLVTSTDEVEKLLRARK
jgi:hypothetical protein